MKESNLMTVGELAQYLRCHSSTIYKLLKKGSIPAFKVGSDWRFNPQAIDEWWRDQQQVK
jgi:excisionase family DNA binding protein